MTLNLWTLLVMLGFLTFFLGYLKYEKQKAAILHIFSIMFFMISGVSSFYLEKVTETGVQAYHGNQIMGLILIPLALVAAGLAVSELTEESMQQAGVY